jgi:riboflavin biosynthesis pyrimidine reductase
MVEGGSQVLSAFLDQGLADLAAITIAPRFIRGLNVYAPMESSLHPGLVIDGVGQFGEDVILWGHFPRK